jgi:hypothetical protein
MIRPHLCLLAALPLLLVGCFHTRVSLDYLPHPSSQRVGPSRYDVGSVIDSRQMKPMELGTMRLAGGFTWETLRLKVPVDEAVRNATLHGLAARGMLAEGRASYRMEIDVEEFYCRLDKAPFASCKIQTRLLSASGQVLHEGAYATSRQDPAYRHHYGDPAIAMRQIAARTLQDAIDQALDDDAMRRAAGEKREP